MRLNTNKGFTLIELMVTVAIVIILATIALPSWTSLIQDTSITSAVNQVQSVYQLTRSEALKRNEDITLTSSNNMRTWTLSNDVSGASSTIKTITLSTEQVAVTSGDGSTDKISITVQGSGFAENKKLAFNWEDEYRCLVIYSSGQTKISLESGDCV